MPKLPTARSLAEVRKLGGIAGVVERRLPHSFVTVDFLGFIDIIALLDGKFIGIQATSGSNCMARIKKIRMEPRAAVWLACGGLIEVWAWRKMGKRNARKLWKLRRVEVNKEMLEGAGETINP